MLKVNDSIRNAYKQKTTQRKSYIKVGDNSFFIQNLDVSADAYDEGNVIGNAIAKIAKFDIETEYVKGLDEFELFDGIWTGEGYEYVSLGTFKLFEEQGTDEFFSSITSYDKLVLFNKPYDNTNVSFPISLYDFLKEICSQANVELETKQIANGDKILFQNLFVEGETLKQILKAICQISGNFAKIKNDKLVLGLYDYNSYIATGNEIVLEDIVEEKTKIKQYGITKQDGTPTPDAPVEIEVGRGKNLLDIGTISFTNSKKYEGLNIPVGTYTFSTKITSSDTDTEKSRVYFYNNGTQVGFVNLNRNTRSSATITLSQSVDTITLYASNGYANSADDTATYEDVQLEKGSLATSYLPYNTIESKSNSTNMFNAKLIPTTNGILVNEDGSKITMPIVTSGNGLTYTNKTLKYFAPNLKVGDVVTLYATNNSANVYNTYIYLDAPASMLWNFGTTKTITENMLNSPVALYGNRFSSGETEQVIISDFRMVLGTEDKPFEPYEESSIQHHLGDNFLADKDYIENGVLNKNIGKVVLDGSEDNWIFDNSQTTPTNRTVLRRYFEAGSNNYISNRFVVENSKPNGLVLFPHNNTMYISLEDSLTGILTTDSDTTKLNKIKEWLSNNNVEVYYELATPEQIQLEATGELRTFEPYTSISNDLDSNMEVEYGKYIEINKDELYQPEYKRTTWKLNKVVLGMKDVEGEFVSKQDDQDVEINGIHQLVINDNPFVYTQQLREEYISELFERIKGFGYVAFESGFEGVPYYELGDLIKIEDKKSIILRYNLQSPKGLESTFSAPSIIDSVVEYTQTPDPLNQKLRLTELRVDKAEGEILATTKKLQEVDTTIDANYQKIINKFGNYTPTSQTVQLEKSVTQLQTDTYTKTEINTKLIDGSVTKVRTTSGTFDEDGMHYEKTGAPTKTTINEAGVSVDSSSSGEELLFAGYDKDINQTIVRTENLTVRRYLVIGKNTRIEDYTDENGNVGGGLFIL